MTKFFLIHFSNYKNYNYKLDMEYVYKILFTKAFELNMVDKNLEYPYIKKEEIKEVAFEAIKDIVDGCYDIEKYLNYFVSQY